MGDGSRVGAGLLIVVLTVSSIGLGAGAALVGDDEDTDDLSQNLDESLQANEAPDATFTFECAGLTCRFDASGSSDADGSVQTYAWSFGDGTPGIGQTVEHTYVASGSYTVVLTVTDDDAATDRTNHPVTVSTGMETSGDDGSLDPDDKELDCIQTDAGCHGVDDVGGSEVDEAEETVCPGGIRAIRPGEYSIDHCSLSQRIATLTALALAIVDCSERSPIRDGSNESHLTCPDNTEAFLQDVVTGNATSNTSGPRILRGDSHSLVELGKWMQDQDDILCQAAFYLCYGYYGTPCSFLYGWDEAGVCEDGNLAKQANDGTNSILDRAGQKLIDAGRMADDATGSATRAAEEAADPVLDVVQDCETGQASGDVPENASEACETAKQIASNPIDGSCGLANYDGTGTSDLCATAGWAASGVCDAPETAASIYQALSTPDALAKTPIDAEGEVAAGMEVRSGGDREPQPVEVGEDSCETVLAGGDVVEDQLDEDCTDDALQADLHGRAGQQNHRARAEFDGATGVRSAEAVWSGTDDEQRLCQEPLDDLPDDVGSPVEAFGTGIEVYAETSVDVTMRERFSGAESHPDSINLTILVSAEAMARARAHGEPVVYHYDDDPEGVDGDGTGWEELAAQILPGEVTVEGEAYVEVNVTSEGLSPFVFGSEGDEDDGTGPIAAFESSCSGLNCTFDASASTDDGPIAAYSWTLGDGDNASQVRFEHSYNRTGTFLVTLNVTDEDGHWDTTTHQVAVAGSVGPTALFTADCDDGRCRFDGRASRDEDGEVVAWSWAFADGHAAEGQIASHTFSATGEYAVTLTVVDDNGSAASSTQVVSIDSVPADDDGDGSDGEDDGEVTGSKDTGTGSTASDGVGSVGAWIWEHPRIALAAIGAVIAVEVAAVVRYRSGDDEEGSGPGDEP